MANIKVDASTLRGNKASIENQISELTSLNARLDALIDDIQNSWTGAASDAYISKMREHKTKAEQMINVLNEFKNYIGQAADNFEQKDKDGASRIRGC